MRLLPLLMPALLVACGDVAIGPSPGEAMTWPQRVTLTTELGAGTTGGVRLADATLVSGEGDLWLTQAMVLALRSPTPESVCEKGVFDALGDIPVDEADCPGGLSSTWQASAYLSASSVHTTEESYAIGLGLLVRDESHTALYRLRVVGDSYDTTGLSTATFDYEPVP